MHDNCAGIPVFADAPGPAGEFDVVANRISDNTKACPASEDASFPISGIGVALLGAEGLKVAGNVITGNVTSAESALSGGVIVTAGLGGTPPTDNQVHGNLTTTSLTCSGTAPARGMPSRATAAKPASRRGSVTDLCVSVTAPAPTGRVHSRHLEPRLVRENRG